MMAEHHLMQKEDLSNVGISQDVTYLKQAEHLMRTTNYSCAIKYTVKALEFNPDSKVLDFFMDALQCIKTFFVDVQGFYVMKILA